MKIINLLDLNVAEFNKLVALTKYEKIIPRKIKFLVAAESLHGTYISAYYIIDRETSKDTDEIIIEQFVCSLMGNWYEMWEKEKSVIISKSHLAEYICKIKENEIADIIESRDRKRAGFTAEPCGLYLNRVIYEKEIFKNENNGGDEHGGNSRN